MANGITNLKAAEILMTTCFNSSRMVIVAMCKSNRDSRNRMQT